MTNSITNYETYLQRHQQDGSHALYKADVIAAWDGYQVEVFRQIVNDEEPVTIADCVRCALITTGINSFDASLTDDAYEQAWVLSTLARHVTGALQQAAIDHCRAIAALASPDMRADTLVQLAGIVADDRRPDILAEAEEAIAAVDHHYARALSRLDLADFYKDEKREQVLAQALEDTHKVVDLWQAATSEAYVAGQLVGPERTSALDHAQQVAARIDDPYWHASALIVIARQLGEEERDDLVKAAWDDARHIVSLTSAARIYASLITLSEDEQRQRHAADICYEVVAEITAELTQARTFMAVGGRLPDDYKQEAILLARGYQNGYARSGALLALADDFTRPGLLPEIRRGLTEYLVMQRSAPRQSLLQFCARPNLFSTSTFSQATVSAVVENIIEICRDWQWKD